MANTRKKVKKSTAVVKRAKKDLSHTPDEYGRKTEDSATGIIAAPVDTRPIIVTGIYNERLRPYLEPLSSDGVAMALLRAEEGDLAAQMLLFEQMEDRDASLHAAMMTRRNAALGLTRVMLPSRGETEADYKKAKEIADDTAKVVDGIEDFNGSLLNALDGIGKGTSVQEIDYDPDGSVCRIRHVPPILYNWDPQTGEFYIEWQPTPTDEAKRIYPYQHPYKFMIHSPRMRAGHPTRRALLRTVVWCYVFRNYALKDHSVFLEVFGMPIRIGKYKRTAQAGDKAQLAQMLRQMASDTWAVISEDTDIEFREIVNRGQEPFSAFSNLLRSEYFLAILGQEGTNITNKYGTKGDTIVKQLIRQDILESDCKQLQETVKRDVLFPIVNYRHGLDAAQQYTPLLHFQYEPPADLKGMADVDKIVLVDMGAGRNVRTVDVLKKYGWESAPKDTKPEDMLVQAPPPGATPPPGQQAPPGAGEPSSTPPEAEK